MSLKKNSAQKIGGSLSKLLTKFSKSAFVPLSLFVFGFMSLASVSAAATAAIVNSPYLYNFNQDGILEEAPSLDLGSPYWWLNSGGHMKMQSGNGSTNVGNLPSTDRWRVLYASTNPTDTDNGYHPQNIFRLVTRSKWQNAGQEAYFVITKDNLSASSNRNSSNGLLLFNRYQDSANLYYAGVRVDGAAVIKKKQGGVYTTLASTPGVFPGTYNRESNPNLLPKNKWIGLKTETINNADGSVTVRLYLDRGWTGVWTLAAQATDRSTPIVSAGYGGIRTDFMDVKFENFRFRTL